METLKSSSLCESSTISSAPPPGQARHPQEMLRSRGQCWQHGHGLPSAQRFELVAQPLFCTVALQHPLHKAGAALLLWQSVRCFAVWVGQEDGQTTGSWWAQLCPQSSLTQIPSSAPQMRPQQEGGSLTACAEDAIEAVEPRVAPARPCHPLCAGWLHSQTCSTGHSPRAQPPTGNRL